MNWCYSNLKRNGGCVEMRILQQLLLDHLRLQTIREREVTSTYFSYLVECHADALQPFFPQPTSSPIILTGKSLAYKKLLLPSTIFDNPLFSLWGIITQTSRHQNHSVFTAPITEVSRYTTRYYYFIKALATLTPRRLPSSNIPLLLSLAFQKILWSQNVFVVAAHHE